jgi:hypothetical protein
MVKSLSLQEAVWDFCFWSAKVRQKCSWNGQNKYYTGPIISFYFCGWYYSHNIQSCLIEWHWKQNKSFVVDLFWTCLERWWFCNNVISVPRLVLFEHLSNPLWWTHPAHFHQVRNHDDTARILLPDHPPEISHSLLHGAWKQWCKVLK